MKYEPKRILPTEFKARYEELCALRDSVNEKNAPLEEQLTAANAEAEAARVRAHALAEQIDANRGNALWLAMKKEIGILAKALSGRRAA